MEQWRAVVGFEGSYEVSDMGRVRSLPRAVGGIWGDKEKPGRVLRPWSSKGYPGVSLRRDGKHESRLVHRLVMEAFVGPRPPGMECRHLDGDPANAALSNLVWGSKLHNERDKRVHGTVQRGERHWNTKLTEEDVREIRRRVASGETCVAVSRDYGVRYTSISRIVGRKRWAHVE